MKVEPLKFPEVLLIYPKVFEDERGTFSEVFNKSISDITDASFVQDNLSYSNKHSLRGLHYQYGDPCGKLIKVIHGRVLDCVVDIRKNSPTYGDHILIDLIASKGQSLWIPPGFAHGFLSLEMGTAFYYKTTAYYDSEKSMSIDPLDEDLGIKWAYKSANFGTWKLNISQQDLNAPSFKQYSKHPHF